jgi:hypothetical protein
MAVAMAQSAQEKEDVNHRVGKTVVLQASLDNTPT